MFSLVSKVCLVVSLFQSSSSFSEKDGRIVGGKVIQLSQAPYQVQLQFRNRPFCGGSIISTSFILTAAHCTDRKSASSITVRLGTDQLGAGGEVISVESLSKHPRFSMTTIDFDFSLVKLSKSITLQQKVKEIIQLPPVDDKIADGSKALVSGWGDTRSSTESRFLLRGAEVSIISQGVCKSAYSFLTSRMVCAGKLSGGVDACQVSISHKFDATKVKKKL